LQLSRLDWLVLLQATQSLIALLLASLIALLLAATSHVPLILTARIEQPWNCRDILLQ